MESDWCSVSAPASARLMGEHAVLRGGPALVFALHPRMTVSASMRVDGFVHISSKFGSETFPLSTIQVNGDHRFMKAALLECQDLVPCGINLKVVSDFEHTVGLGSSAAITVATLGALLQQSFGYIDQKRCVQMAQSAIRVVQGEGSGADAAASVYGGVILFYAEGCRVQRLQDALPLHLAYSGMKTPTKEVIAVIRQKEKEDPEVVRALFYAINCITEKAVQAILKKDMQCFGECLNEAHGCMVALGLENRSLASLRGRFLSDLNVMGCKISGSGLGDCVVLLAEKLLDASSSLCLPLSSEASGVRVEV